MRRLCHQSLQVSFTFSIDSRLFDCRIRVSVFEHRAASVAVQLAALLFSIVEISSPFIPSILGCWGNHRIVRENGESSFEGEVGGALTYKQIRRNTSECELLLSMLKDRSGDGYGVFDLSKEQGRQKKQHETCSPQTYEQ